MFARLTQDLFVTRRADTVEDDTGDPDPGVERREAVQQRRGAVTLTTSVYHQDHRRAEHRGHLRSRPLRGAREAVGDPSVEQPHDALDDSDVGGHAAMPVQRADQLIADEYRVE